jgi:CheY-like chemotaxis protein
MRSVFAPQGTAVVLFAQQPIVLVIEDNEASRDNMGELLASAGFECWLEPSAEDALRRLEGEPRPPDAILLDLRIPGMSARRFVCHVKERAAWARAPIILTTAAWQDEIPAELTVDAVLLKPFKPERLVAMIRAAIAHGVMLSDRHP